MAFPPNSPLSISTSVMVLLPKAQVWEVPDYTLRSSVISMDTNLFSNPLHYQTLFILEIKSYCINQAGLALLSPCPRAKLSSSFNTLP